LHRTSRRHNHVVKNQFQVRNVRGHPVINWWGIYRVQKRCGCRAANCQVLEIRNWKWIENPVPRNKKGKRKRRRGPHIATNFVAGIQGGVASEMDRREVKFAQCRPQLPWRVVQRVNQVWQLTIISTRLFWLLKTTRKATCTMERSE